MTKCSFEQSCRADDIGFHAGGGGIDGTIDMALRGEMIHRAGAVLRKDRGHRSTIANVGADEDVTRAIQNRR